MLGLAICFNTSTDCSSGFDSFIYLTQKTGEESTMARRIPLILGAIPWVMPNAVPTGYPPFGPFATIETRAKVCCNLWEEVHIPIIANRGCAVPRKTALLGDLRELWEDV
jgi:hypothetical protein